EHSIHGENAAADILPVEVAAKADLLQLDFVGAKDLGRATHAIVPWIVETVNVVSVKADFRSEELRIPYRIFVSRSAVKPGPVGISKRFCGTGLLWLGLVAGLCRCGIGSCVQRDALHCGLRLLTGGFSRLRGLSLELCLKLLDSCPHLLQFFEQFLVAGVAIRGCSSAIDI